MSMLILNVKEMATSAFEPTQNQHKVNKCKINVRIIILCTPSILLVKLCWLLHHPNECFRVVALSKSVATPLEVQILLQFFYPYPEQCIPSIRCCVRKMLIYIMNNKLVPYLDEKFKKRNQHNGFCLTHLLWNPIMKKNGVTIFISSVCSMFEVWE